MSEGNRVMQSIIKSRETDQPVRPGRQYRKDLTIALQSSLAAGLCLGLPVGLMFWILLLQRTAPSPAAKTLLDLLQNYPAPPIIVDILGVLGWAVLMSKISGYRQWWWLAAAAMAGQFVGQGLLLNSVLDTWVGYAAPGLAVHVRFGIVLAGVVLSVTAGTGLLLGLLLMNWKAGLALAASTALVSVCAALATQIILDASGLRVGSGNDAMPKVAALATIAAALAGGALLGVVFNRYVKAGLRKAMLDD